MGARVPGICPFLLDWDEVLPTPFCVERKDHEGSGCLGAIWIFAL